MGYLVRAYYSISPTMYYKDDSCWSVDLKSKATEDIISIGSFLEVLVLIIMYLLGKYWSKVVNLAYYVLDGGINTPLLLPWRGETLVVQIVLWYLDSGCSKHMTGDRSQLTNFVHKFLGTVKFGNDQVSKIMGYGDYQIGNITISRMYYVEGLGHNLFLVGQFCDSDLEVKFLASKDEAPDFIIKFLKMIQVRLNAAVRNIRTDNGTEFVNKTL
ncbi:hypothetical protein Tco_1458751 [Tanacetum coccineum]